MSKPKNETSHLFKTDEKTIFSFWFSSSINDILISISQMQIYGDLR